MHKKTIACISTCVCTYIRVHIKQRVCRCTCTLVMILAQNGLFKLNCDKNRLLSGLQLIPDLPIDMTWLTTYCMPSRVWPWLLVTCPWIPVVTLACDWTLYPVFWFSTLLPGCELNSTCILTVPLPYILVSHCPTVNDLWFVSWLLLKYHRVPPSGPCLVVHSHLCPATDSSCSPIHPPSCHFVLTSPVTTTRCVE